MNLILPIPGHLSPLSLVQMSTTIVDGQMACRIAPERCVNVRYDSGAGH